jgi:DnaJ-like protein
MMPALSDGQECFVMMPFGDEGSDLRRDADRIVNEIIRPASAKFGYLLVRSDMIAASDSIHKDVIVRLADAPLAIANLTGKNPSVFYALAFRHTIEKPVILICAQGEMLPFDPTIYNVIWFDLSDDESITRCTEAIIQQIEASAETLKGYDNPISKMIDIQQLRSNMAFTAEDVRKAFEKLPDFNVRPYDLRMLIQRLRQNNIKTKGQLAELLSRGILDTIRTLYFEELYRRKDNLLDHEGIAVWGSYFVHRGVTPDTMQRVRKAMAGFPEYQVTHGDLVIFEGRYGANDTWRDVTDILRSEVRDSRLELRVVNETFRRKSDPVRWNPSVGTQKQLEVRYSYKNQYFFTSYLEGEQLELPLN